MLVVWKTKKAEARRASPAALAEEIPRATQEMAFLREKPHNTVLAYVVFWYSGILGWRP